MKKQIFSAIVASAVLFTIPAYAQVKKNSLAQERQQRIDALDKFQKNHYEKQKAFSDSLEKTESKRNEERHQTLIEKRRQVIDQIKNKDPDNGFDIEIEEVDDLNAEE